MEDEQKGAQGGQSADGGDAGTADRIKIKDGDQEVILTAEDVKRLRSEQASLQQTVQNASPFLRMAEKYGADPNALAENAEAAFATMSDLIKRGVINERGELIQKAGGDSGAGKQQGDLGGGLKGGQGAGGDRTEAVVAQALGTIKALSEKVNELEEGQGGIYRKMLEGEIKTKHPDFTEEDIARVIGRAHADRNKGIWDHAKEQAAAKAGSVAAVKQELEKAYGISFAELDKNKLREAGADGGGGVIPGLEGKKILLPEDAKRRGIKDYISPRDAMVTHFNHVLKK